VVEIVGGGLLIVGFLTRLAAILLLIDISVAILSTKIPMLMKSGLWAAAHEARTDICMWLKSLFLIIVGAGRGRSLARWHKLRNRQDECGLRRHR